ncbi:hypothetical protein [Novosphingobium guangzhouense]|uniref:hypothetical protein n=1 Tax=Novosphingobium guangzhouense TaxID=1850347 RepID=UPI0011AFC914|nr:hypothetical protein [Novosphingobium guangzhouense]
MTVAATITTRIVVLFLIGAAGQVGGSLLLGRTDAFRNIGWSIICLSVYMVSFWALATVIREGGPLSLIMPALATIVPIVTIIVAVFVMGEAASWQRLGLLLFACLVIGYAGTV